MKIYPNPGSEKFKAWLTIKEFDNKSKIMVGLFDNSGRKLALKEVEYVDGGYIWVTFNLTDYPGIQAGVYRLTLLIDGKPVDSKNMVVSG